MVIQKNQKWYQNVTNSIFLKTAYNLFNLNNILIACNIMQYLRQISKTIKRIARIGETPAIGKS